MAKCGCDKEKKTNNYTNTQGKDKTATNNQWGK